MIKGENELWAVKSSDPIYIKKKALVLLKNVVRFGIFLILSSCSFAFSRLVYPLSKERLTIYLSCELKEEF
jgi:hypothetical protein